MKIATGKHRYTRKQEEASISDQEKTKTVSPQKFPKPTNTQGTHKKFSGCKIGEKVYHFPENEQYN